jgi:hypothetical protein
MRREGREPPPTKLTFWRQFVWLLLGLVTIGVLVLLAVRW